MKRLIFIILIMLSKFSFASFPIIEKTTEPEPGTLENYILFAVLIAISIARSFQNKKKYGKWFKPWSAYSNHEKILAYIIFGFLSIFVLVLFLHVIQSQFNL